jgi:hypothetical protein
VEKTDHEHDTVSYFRKGHLLSQFKLAADQLPQPTYERHTVTQSIRDEIKKMLDQKG